MTADASVLFTQAEVQRAKKVLANLAADWTAEWPMRIHESGRGSSFGLGSSPPFSPEFIGYIGDLTCKNQYCTRCGKRRTAQPTDNESGRVLRKTKTKIRATRAFRKLRRHAPIEFDVLWMAVMYHLTVEQITARLNDRAISLGRDDRYTITDTSILAMAGIDKVSRWF